jgi:hypothetical protein
VVLAAEEQCYYRMVGTAGRLRDWEWFSLQKNNATPGCQGPQDAYLLGILRLLLVSRFALASEKRQDK